MSTSSQNGATRAEKPTAMDTKNKAEGTATVVASLSDISLCAPHTWKGAMNSATTSGPN